MTFASASDVFALLKDLPAGEWVAVSEKQNRVLSFGPDILQVLEDGRCKAGDEEPIILRSPEEPLPLYL